MGKEEKILKKWRNSKGSKQEVKLTEVVIVLEGYLSEYLIDSPTTGSHLYKIQHPALNQMKGTIEGILTIPVHKNKVKRQYVEKIIKAIELISQED